LRGLNMTLIRLVLVALLCPLLGCALLQRGPTDEELLGDLLRGWQAAMDARDVDKVMTFYSKDFMSPQGADYEGMKEALERFVPQFDDYGVKLSSADASITIEGDTATIEPITLEADMGSMTLSLIATKEAPGVWRITNSEMEQ